MSVFTKLTGLLPGSAASRARNAYDQATHQSFTAWLELDGGGAADADRRGLLLRQVASAERLMAAHYADGYGAPDKDGGAEVVRMHLDTALLLEVLASASGPDLGPWERMRVRESWEAGFGTVLDEISAAAPHPEVVAELLTRLYFPVCRLVDGDVAETVCRLTAAIVRSVAANTDAAASTAG